MESKASFTSVGNSEMRRQSLMIVLVLVILEICANCATNANVVTDTARSNETSSYDQHPPSDGTFTEAPAAPHVKNLHNIEHVLDLRGAAVCAGWVQAVVKVAVLLTLTKLSSNVIRKNIDFPYLAYHQLDISSAFEL